MLDRLVHALTRSLIHSFIREIPTDLSHGPVPVLDTGHRHISQQRGLGPYHQRATLGWGKNTKSKVRSIMVINCDKGREGNKTAMCSSLGGVRLTETAWPGS